MPISFDTLKREHNAVHIPDEHNPELLVHFFEKKSFFFFLQLAQVVLSVSLQRLTKPHVDSFNSLFEGGLEEAVADLDVKDIADQSGNRLYCISSCFLLFAFPFSFFPLILIVLVLLVVWVDQIQVGKPMLSDSEINSKERYIYPSEVGSHLSSLVSFCHLLKSFPLCRSHSVVSGARATVPRCKSSCAIVWTKVPPRQRPSLWGCCPSWFGWVFFSLSSFPNPSQTSSSLLPPSCAH